MSRGLRPVPLYALLGHQSAIGYLVDGEITITGSLVAAVWLLLGLLALHVHRIDEYRIWWAVLTGPKIPTRAESRMRKTRERHLAEWVEGRT